MERIPTNGEVRFDQFGHPWVVNLQLSTKYPNGAINKLVLMKEGVPTVVRYDEAGQYICGNPALA